MKNKFLVLTALVVAVTSLGIDQSHARRIRFSIPAAKAAPAPVAKPAPVAAAPRKDAQPRGNIMVTPGIAIRPPNGPAPTRAPVAAVAASAPIAAAAAGTPAVASSPDKASKHEEPPAPPAPVQRHFVELNSTPPQPQREIASPAGHRARQPAVLCFKTATGQCSRFE